MRRCFSVAAIVLALALVVGAAPTTQPVVEPPGVGMVDSPSAGLPVVQLRGDGTQLGEEQGRLLGDRIRTLQSAYLTQRLTSTSEKMAAMIAASLFEARLEPAHRAEVAALAAASGISEKQMMLEQCFLDLMPVTACSTVTLPPSASPDGVARFGRNLDFPSLGFVDRTTVLLAFHPTGRNAFVSVSWPGMMGVLSGMNERGLCLANMEIKRQPRFPSALPYTLLYRTVLERCATVDEAIKLLGDTPRQTTNNVMLMDAAGDRAVVELTPEAIHVRRAPATAALVCTNHQRGNDLDTPGKCWRFDLLHDRAREEFGSIGVEPLEQMLAGAAQGNMTVQSMIFEPQKRVMYLATGADAPLKPFHRIDVGTLLAPAPQ